MKIYFFSSNVYKYDRNIVEYFVYIYTRLRNFFELNVISGLSSNYQFLFANV